MALQTHPEYTIDEFFRHIERNKKKLLTIINLRKTSYMGHILRNDKYLLQQMLERITRKIKSWFENVREWTHLSVEELFHVERNKHAFMNIKIT